MSNSGQRGPWIWGDEMHPVNPVDQFIAWMGTLTPAEQEAHLEKLRAMQETDAATTPPTPLPPRDATFGQIRNDGNSADCRERTENS